MNHELQFIFSKELIKRVKTNWMFKDYTSEFKGCITDSDYCLTFIRVCNEYQGEYGLQNALAACVYPQLKKA